MNFLKRDVNRMILHREIWDVMVVIIKILLIVLSVSISNVVAKDAPMCTISIAPGESIQEAIDRAPKEAVICLAEGTWKENLIITKGLTLRGGGTGKTVITAEDRHINELTLSHRVIPESLEASVLVRISLPSRSLLSDIDLPEVRIEGITLDGYSEILEMAYSLPSDYGVLVEGDLRVFVSDCSISGGDIGVGILGGTGWITGCMVSGNGAGIVVSTYEEIIIDSCTIVENRNFGIRLTDNALSVIERSTVSRNRGSGIRLMEWARAMIRDCTISRNGASTFKSERDSGITLSTEAWAKIQNCTISGNSDDGIYLLDSSQAHIEKNKITNNGGYGVCFYLQECGFDSAPEKFEGQVEGKANQFSENGKGSICPEEIKCLTSEKGCEYPKIISCTALGI